MKTFLILLLLASQASSEVIYNKPMNVNEPYKWWEGPFLNLWVYYHNYTDQKTQKEVTEFTIKPSITNTGGFLCDPVFNNFRMPTYHLKINLGHPLSEINYYKTINKKEVLDFTIVVNKQNDQTSKLIYCKILFEGCTPAEKEVPSKDIFYSAFALKRYYPLLPYDAKLEAAKNVPCAPRELFEDNRDKVDAIRESVFAVIGRR